MSHILTNDKADLEEIDFSHLANDLKEVLLLESFNKKIILGQRWAVGFKSFIPADGSD